MDDRRSDLQRPAADPRRGSEPLEQGFDRLVSAGRQLVDGVSGARPGSRSSQRSAGGATASPGRPRLGELGRWVEDKLEWILEDEDDWREPWQEPRPGRLARSRPVSIAQRPLPAEQTNAPDAPSPSAIGGGRRPLEAISRRGERRRPAVSSPPLSSTPTSSTSPPAADDWPDDSSFARPRWQRPLKDPGRAPDLSTQSARDGAEPRLERARPLPRSSRRRPG